MRSHRRDPSRKYCWTRRARVRMGGGKTEAQQGETCRLQEQVGEQQVVSRLGKKIVFFFLGKSRCWLRLGRDGLTCTSRT